ncbi:PQQ-binding-like beta-propeller repeat protein [Sciscionella marina]|uniref:outer membrane protein assembly factor BamB family protein n=1 Tax=Sciscionella marina TaxID=508770 RepID=UPI0003A2FE53|nr:PQQ-binding-like beta-propeller repeat protein [Sciscionella marina]
MPDDAWQPMNTVGRGFSRTAAVRGVPRAILLTAVTVLLAVLTGCGPSADRQTESPRSSTGRPTPFADHPPRVPALNLAPDPWESIRHGSVARAEQVEVHGDAIVALGADEEDESSTRIAVLDADSGTQRWALSFGEPVPGLHGAVFSDPSHRLHVTGSDEDWSIVVQYHDPHGAPNHKDRLVVLSANGQVKRAVPVAELPGPGSHDHVLGLREWQVSGSTLVFAQRWDAGECNAETEVRLTAVDLDTGRVRWTKNTEDGLLPEIVAGNVVAGCGTRVWPGSRPHVVALDLSTGAQRWTLADRYLPSQSAAHTNSWATHGSIVPVAVQGRNSPQRTVFLDADSGNRLAVAPDSGVCAGDRDTVACLRTTDRRQRLSVVRAPTGGQTLSAKEVPGDEVSALAGGRIFVEGPETGESACYDEAGNSLGRLPGKVIAASKRYVVLGKDRFDSTRSRFAVHRIR